MSRYQEFLEACPDPISRIGALINGVCTPDLKGITLWSMKKPCTWKELYEEVLNFSGLNSGEFPIASSSIWGYVKGQHTDSRGILDKIGMVSEVEVAKSTGRVVTAYEKTDAGEDFGDPVVALGTSLVNKLIEKKNPHSLSRIFGSPHKRRDARYLRGYSTFRVIKLLAENPNTEFRRQDIINELYGEISDCVISYILNLLGKARIIDYDSPYRDKRPRGWAVYRLKNGKISHEAALEEIRKIRPHFDSPGYLRKVIDFINNNPDKEFESNSLSKKLSIHSTKVSEILSLLEMIGYLSSEFNWRRRSRAKANEFTLIVWNEFLEPIGRVAESLDPYYPEFRKALEFYEENPEIRKKHIRNQIGVYSLERKGYKVGEVVRQVLEEAARMKLNVLVMSRGEIDESSIIKQLRELILEKERLNPNLRVEIRWEAGYHPVTGETGRYRGLWEQWEPIRHRDLRIGETHTLRVGIKSTVDLTDIEREVYSMLESMGYNNVRIIHPEFIGKMKNNEIILKVMGVLMIR